MGDGDVTQGIDEPCIATHTVHHHKTSVNKAVISLLEESLGKKPQKKEQVRYHDLDHLAGSWTKEEAEAFDKITQSFRTIDPDLWK